MTDAASSQGGDSAPLAFIGQLGGLPVYAGEKGDSFTRYSRLGWRRIGSPAALLCETNARIAALERGRIVLIATLAAFPLALIALLVMVLSRPLAPPGPPLSLAAAVVGSLLTGGLVFLGAGLAAALLRPAVAPTLPGQDSMTKAKQSGPENLNRTQSLVRMVEMNPKGRRASSREPL